MNKYQQQGKYKIKGCLAMRKRAVGERGRAGEEAEGSYPLGVVFTRMECMLLTIYLVSWCVSLVLYASLGQAMVRASLFRDDVTSRCSA